MGGTATIADAPRRRDWRREPVTRRLPSLTGRKVHRSHADRIRSRRGIDPSDAGSSRAGVARTPPSRPAFHDPAWHYRCRALCRILPCDVRRGRSGLRNRPRDGHRPIVAQRPPRRSRDRRRIDDSGSPSQQRHAASTNLAVGRRQPRPRPARARRDSAAHCSASTSGASARAS